MRATARGGLPLSSRSPRPPLSLRRQLCRPKFLVGAGLVLLWHSLLAVVMMHQRFVAEAEADKERDELLGRISTLQQDMQRRTAELDRERRRVLLDQQHTTPSAGSRPAAALPDASPGTSPGSSPAAPSPLASVPPVRCRHIPPPPPEPKALDSSVVIIGGRTRLTLLTAALVRVEHLGNATRAGRFDDRASFAFVHRRLPTPTYEARLAACTLLPGPSPPARCLVVSTAALRLEYAAPQRATKSKWLGPELKERPQGGYEGAWEAVAPTHATIAIKALGMGSAAASAASGGSRGAASAAEQAAVWWPGRPNPRQLPGTVRTLDKADGLSSLDCVALNAPTSEAREGARDAQHCAMGVVSRDGWAAVDDTRGGRFDGAGAAAREDGGWDWATPLDREDGSDGDSGSDAAAGVPTTPKATDTDHRCREWAGSGECTRNPGFMASTCPAACARERRREAARAASMLRSDVYVFAHGLDFKAALRDLSLVGGAQPVPPRYALGAWYSRWWPMSDWESVKLLREFDDFGVPADVLITDMDWHHTCYRATYGSEGEKHMDASDNWPCWSGFTWDRKYFPQPEAFLSECKARGVHNGLNLHFQSGLLKGEDSWEPFRAAMGLPESATFSRFAPLNKSYSSHFHSHVLAPLERQVLIHPTPHAHAMQANNQSAMLTPPSLSFCCLPWALSQGVDFWWLDWQQGEGLFAGTDTPEANPTWWLNYVYATQPDGRAAEVAATDASTAVAAAAASASASPPPRRRRRLIMHRYGGLGNQRYPIGFSGDVMSSWASLRFQPHFTASAANVNFGYWSHDIGGFYEPVAPELYVRWVQFGALSPIFRAHGFRRPDIVKRFWHFAPGFFAPMRAALRLRLELLPHLYTAARAAHLHGTSPLRPLYHEWPTLDAAYAHDGEYLLGADASLVVAPVTSRLGDANGGANGGASVGGSGGKAVDLWADGTAGAPPPLSADAPLARAALWVPPGAWVQRHTGLLLRGPAALTQHVAIDEVPMLHATGAVLFGQPPPDAEWPHCGGGSAAGSATGVGGGSSGGSVGGSSGGGGSGGWLGRAHQLPRCLQAALWLLPQRSTDLSAAAASEEDGKAAGGRSNPGNPSNAGGEVAGGGGGEALSGAAELYEDDGWSDDYRAGVYSTRRLSWRWEPAGATATATATATTTLRVTVEPPQGCFATVSPAESAEPRFGPTDDATGGGGGGGGRVGSGGSGGGGGGGSGGSGGGPHGRADAARSWRLLLHGVPPPTRVRLWRQAGATAAATTATTTAAAAKEEPPVHEELLVPFASPAARERWRRSDARAAHWGYDAERLCVVVWLFSQAADEALTIRLDVSDADADGAATAQRVGLTAAVARAQLAKGVLDETYPDTQPQDYDRVTWLAGVGSRLAALPANFSREMAALPALLETARAQARDGEPAKRATGANKARVRNATAWLTDFAPRAVAAAK